MDNKAENKDKVISTSDWVLTKLILLVPIVNIIMLFVWAFNSKTNLNKSNWAKASIIVWTIGFLFYFIIIFLFIAFFMNMFNKLFMIHV